MVVLALAIGVAEQDDFANIPDLQETAQAAPPAANQEAPPEKRYLDEWAWPRASE